MIVNFYLARRPLRRPLPEQLRHDQRPGRAAARRRRLGHQHLRPARLQHPRLARSAEAGGLRHDRQRRGRRDPQPEPRVAGRADRPAACRPGPVLLSCRSTRWAGSAIPSSSATSSSRSARAVPLPRPPASWRPPGGVRHAQLRRPRSAASRCGDRRWDDARRDATGARRLASAADIGATGSGTTGANRRAATIPARRPDHDGTDSVISRRRAGRRLHRCGRRITGGGQQRRRRHNGGGATTGGRSTTGGRGDRRRSARAAAR